MRQEILSTLDFKAMIIGNKVADMIMNELSSSETAKETKKSKSEKNVESKAPTKKVLPEEKEPLR
jgi:hypothetical protein